MAARDEQNFVSTDSLEAALQLLNWNNIRVSKELGYSSSAISNWRLEKRMPRVVSLALERILDGKTVDVEVPETLILIKAKNGKSSVIWSGYPQGKVELNGKVFLLVPYEEGK
jgi:hypothetical protein